MPEFLIWLEKSPIGVMVRESPWGFPAVVALHIIGLTISVGILVWFDLRLLGVFMPAYSAPMLHRRLRPWFFSGFAVMFLSGIVLLIGFATPAYGSTYFWIKMSVLLLAAINAVIYHRITERNFSRWSESGPPRAAKVAAILSIVFWGVIIICGRMMSYTIF